MNQHFAALVVGLATQANSALDGELPAGAAEQGATDTRELAKGLIDTIGALEEKTDGNLDDDEKQLLEQILTGLRFRFATGNES